MTLTSDMLGYSKISVGEGGSASGEYPVIAVEENTKTVGVEGTAGVTALETTIRVTCFGEAASEDEIAQFNEDLRTRFTRQGDRVLLYELAGAVREFVAGGTEPMQRGYPRISVERLDQVDGMRSVGALQFFRLNIEIRENAAATDPVHHEYETQTSFDILGRATITERGTVRTLNASSATGWLQTNVITPAQTAAAANSQAFSYSTTVKLDTSEVSYEYTRQAGALLSISFNINNAQVATQNVHNPEGGVYTRTSGFAIGDEATDFAVDQRPSLGSSQLMVRENITDPSVPDGRVDFSYEFVTATTDAALGSTKVLSYRREVVTVQPGGQPLLASTFAEADPLLMRGPVRTWIYREITTMTYIAASKIDISTIAALGPEMDADNLIGPTIDLHGFNSFGARTLRIERTYMYATEQTVPGPEIVITPGVS